MLVILQGKCTDRGKEQAPKGGCGFNSLCSAPITGVYMKFSLCQAPLMLSSPTPKKNAAGDRDSPIAGKDCIPS